MCHCCHKAKRGGAPEDLHGGRGVLGETCEAAGVRDEPRADQLADQRGQVRRHLIHLREKVDVQRATIVQQREHAPCQHPDVDHVQRRDVHSCARANTVK